MGNNFNFKGFGNEPPLDGSGSWRLAGNFSLSRQPSIYSLTFDELQSTLGGNGKDFGSMNMDELLKNIWSAEETQNTAAAAQEVGNHHNQAGYLLQRQGSLSLPRTLSLKTVDEVWRDMSKEFDGEAGTNVTQRQPTLGEITLEEFLVRAGVVREDAQLASSNPNAAGFFGDLTQPSISCNNTSFGIDFQQPSRGIGMMNTRVEINNPISLQPSNLPVDVSGGVRSSQQQASPPRLTPQQQQQQPPIFSKQTTVSYTPPITIPSSAQLGGPGLRGGALLPLADPVTNGNMTRGAALQGGGGLALSALGGGGIGVARGSPAALSSDGVAKSSGDTSSVSPVPYLFNGGLRGRKYNNAVEKVIERRQRRMIKNRESAARSRARKQAYTMELEQEVAKLKEENQDLRQKQAEAMEMQKKQALELLNAQQGRKRQCLRRTRTGPW
ncbi:ARM REPEAT PROTEIN INTERACTING WITH abf2 [Dionaea muscipula]